MGRGSELHLEDPAMKVTKGVKRATKKSIQMENTSQTPRITEQRDSHHA